MAKGTVITPSGQIGSRPIFVPANPKAIVDENNPLTYLYGIDHISFTLKGETHVAALSAVIISDQ